MSNDKPPTMDQLIAAAQTAYKDWQKVKADSDAAETKEYAARMVYIDAQKKLTAAIEAGQ